MHEFQVTILLELRSYFLEAEVTEFSIGLVVVAVDMGVVHYLFIYLYSFREGLGEGDVNYL